ncbi:biotin--[acetyl-CoA-carboxylase] ligase [Leptodesmis sichuanensis]|uniref:biotin--[acetyl-CoA-carboxylase] ligase n=1 Tax=Leptodesmis sichuanensis TaxID=2906798 RepID=UPI001F1A8DBA|nr:biotin--[acetyl-CoA-carboxylase] ligase [Leptodesmis sichuanensis]
MVGEPGLSRERFWAAYRVVLLGMQAEQTIVPIDLHLFELVSSTNEVVWALLEQGAGEGTTAIARSQTAGRGQWGRQWSSEPGGLYLSVALMPDLPVEEAAQLTLCTAWGIATALRIIPGKLSGVADRIPVQLKWLNDLVLQGRKLGGILTETRVFQGRITKAVVGVGINWTNAVPETGINLQSFLATASVPLIESLEMLAAIVLYGLLCGYQFWHQEGIQAILPRYLELLAHRDRPVPVEGVLGTIVGVTSKGELRLSLKSPQRSSAEPISDFSTPEVLIQPGTISLGYPL